MFTSVQNSRLPFAANIRIGDTQASLPPVLPLRLVSPNDAQDDSVEPESVDFSSIAPTLSGQTAPFVEPVEGQTVQLPDVTIPAMAQVALYDPIASALSYNGSIAQSGPLPHPFGLTKPWTHALSGVSVTRSAGNFAVRATVDNPITYQVAGGTDTNIASETDPSITLENYSKVASDLTPNMSKMNGKPPRRHFWAEDLTIRHERFHSQEALTFGGQGVTAAQAWLNGHAAAKVAAVQRLVNQVPGRVANTVANGMQAPAREQRAYADGAPFYLARANAIKAKGDAHGYPSSKGGLSRGAKVGIGLAGGAAGGAVIGAVAGGGVGAAIGAGIGAAVGLVTGLLI
jgi:hypothetical protein